jgi:hypothetical protein
VAAHGHGGLISNLQVSAMRTAVFPGDPRTSRAKLSSVTAAPRGAIAADPSAKERSSSRWRSHRQPTAALPAHLLICQRGHRQSTHQPSRLPHPARAGAAAARARHRAHSSPRQGGSHTTSWSRSGRGRRRLDPARPPRASSARTTWSSATWASISAICVHSSVRCGRRGQRPWSQVPAAPRSSAAAARPAGRS